MKARLRFLHHWVFCSAAVALFVTLVPIWAPREPDVGIDISWLMVIEHAFLHGWQFGRDIVFTHGPLGFLVSTTYDARTYPLVVGYGVTLAAALGGWMAVRLSALPVPARWVLLATWVWAMPLHGELVFHLAALIALLEMLDARTPRQSAFPLLLAVLLALGGIAKVTVLVFACAAVGLADAYRVVRYRAWPVFSVTLAGVYLAGWVLTGQALSNLPAFLAGAFELTRGFDAAMLTPGPTRAIWAYVPVAAVYLVPAAWLAWRRRDLRLAVLAAFVAFDLFVLFKHGFVRNDAHRVMAIGGLALVCAVLTYTLRGHLRLVAWQAGVAGLVLLMAAAPPLTERRLRFFRELGLQADALLLNVQGRAPGIYQDRHDRKIAAIRETHPLPAIHGTVDVIPWNQAVALAHGLSYQPRPVFQSYAVYTERLLSLNLAYLRSERAADTLLFAVAPIDLHYPSLEEGALWPDIMARYAQSAVTPDFLVLSKRPQPGSARFSPLAVLSGRLAAWVDVPPADGPVWARIDVSLTPLGSVAATLYRPPIVWMRVRLADGREKRFRFIPPMARAGFLLSPLIETDAEFSALLNGDLPRLRGNVVRSVTILGDAGATWSLHELFPVELQTLAIVPPKAEGGAKASAR